MLLTSLVKTHYDSPWSESGLYWGLPVDGLRPGMVVSYINRANKLESYPPGTFVVDVGDDAVAIVSIVARQQV